MGDKEQETGFTPEDHDNRKSKSEQLYRDFQKRRESGEDLSFEAFIKQLPEFEEELRKIYARSKVKGEVSPGPSQSPELSGAIGDFKIVREIGKGGMGTVYEADQISLNRKVALKVLPSHLSFSNEAVKKFKREAEAGGRQSHPGIVAIYAVGEREGVHYIAQELITDGVTLADRLDGLRKEADQPPGYFREVAQLISEIAEALQHAHDSGVIHRDVKPSNILLTENGTPKVTDFGLAKVEDALALSRTGDFAGTPYYMSPEQAMRRQMGIDHRTDIFSLGVTLYEMLTLQRPFDGKTSQEVFKQIVILDPINPHKRNPRVPHDLSVVCLKAMEKDPDRRYQSMVELAEDLTRFLDGDVILAKPAGPGIRFWKRIKRNPVVSAAVGVALAAVVVFAVVVPWIIAAKEREAKKEIESRRLVSENIFTEILRLSDLKRLSDLRSKADKLWPACPGNITNYINWLAEAEDLLKQLPGHRSSLKDFRDETILERIRLIQERRTLESKLFNPLTNPEYYKWEDKNKFKRILLDDLINAIREGKLNQDDFTVDISPIMSRADEVDSRLQELGVEYSNENMGVAGGNDQSTSLWIWLYVLWRYNEEEFLWWKEALEELVYGLELISDENNGLINQVKDRLTFASTIQKKSIDSHRSSWDEAIASIADREKSPHYNGLVIEPMIGFVPVGRDQKSGLWEFAHLQTGEIPKRGSDGKLILTEEMGLVFVLIPGGSFMMGSERESNEKTDDPFSFKQLLPELNSSPIHKVTLNSFLLSKYEMTQGQWLRFTKKNPSMMTVGAKVRNNERYLLNPVETVSWIECRLVLNRLALRMPTEAEWEFAFRGGTTTDWWNSKDGVITVEEGNSIDEILNSVDKYLEDSFKELADSLNSGCEFHSQIGNSNPNPFGLYEMTDNLYEWCADTYQRNYTGAPVNGSAWMVEDSLDRVVRGYHSGNLLCRWARGPSYRYRNLGIRPAVSLP